MSLKKARIIARLDVKGPNVVKGIQFEALRIMGKPGALAKEYFLQGADELLYLDIVASLYRRENLLHIVREASKSIFIPFTAGGGVRTIEDIYDLLQAGAEKVAVNTAATKRPELIKEAAERFGSQCIVISIEAKYKNNSWEAYIDNGRQTTGLDVVEWARQAESLGAGEILLTSVDKEGTERGLDVELIRVVSSAVSIPVIASGGASSPEDIGQTLQKTGADAVAAASILHYGKTTLADIKDAVQKAGLNVRALTSEERSHASVLANEVNVTDYNKFTLKQFEDNVAIDPRTSEKETRAKIDPAEADVVIIDYGINNVRSVALAFEHCGKLVAIGRTPDAILAAKRLVLPGVGAFGDGINALKEKGFFAPILEQVRKGTPFLGICLGMQLLFSQSEEFGMHTGLGLIKGNVISFPEPRTASLPGYKLPHIGWNSIQAPRGREEQWKYSILADTRPEECVYFVHSFYPVPDDTAVVLATCSYGRTEFCAVLKSNNITATQFHPEKSGLVGLNMLEKFCEEPTA